MSAIDEELEQLFNLRAHIAATIETYRKNLQYHRNALVAANNILPVVLLSDIFVHAARAPGTDLAVASTLR